ncbi:MAG: hypothetical protein H7301_04275 [Cryobacterium sp.]|nr:hypothetical protein [Oligoflexia bacterium]
MSGANRPKRMGEFMMEKGLLHADWIDPIMEHARENGLRFGDSAVKLGYVTEAQLREVVAEPYHQQEIFHLDPQFFPKSTENLIPLEIVLRLGVLPLGMKKEWTWFRTVARLNLGLLNVKDSEAKGWVEHAIPNVKAIKTFQLLPEEFLQTVELCYGVERSTLLEKKPEQLDLNLSLYLQLERRKSAPPVIAT